jgi:HD superfamily phosphohydrolase YqeK
MSAADLSESDIEDLTPIELAAARGELPGWARAGTRRREHMGRVSALLEQWAHELRLGEAEVLRWAAVGWLHDVLRDEDHGVLIHEVGPKERDLPGPMLHGPAAANRLAGKADPRVLHAIRYHTIGHPSLDLLGRALYLADYLEPGRDFLPEWTEQLRRRMPHDLDEVLVEVLGQRIRRIIEVRKPLRGETSAFWSSLVSGGAR